MSSSMKVSPAMLWVLMSFTLMCSAGEQTHSDDRALVQRLIGQLRSGGPGATQRDAAFDLGKLGPKAKDAVPALIDALDTKNDDDLRIDVVRALGEIAPDDKRVIARLAALLSELGGDPDPTDRVGGFLYEETGRTLAKAGPPAIPTLIEKLAIREDRFGEDEFGTSGAATEALGRIGLPALPALLDALKDPSRRQSAAQAIGDIGAQGSSVSVPALLRHVDDTDEGVRSSVYNALGKIGPTASDAVPALVAALDEAGGLRFDAVYALGRIGPAASPALPRLERLWAETGYNDQVKWAIDQIQGQSNAKPKPK